MNIPIIIKIIIILVIFIFVTLLLRYSIAQKKERRISSYSLLPLKDNNIPLGDKIKKFYLLLVKKNRKYLKRINYFNKKSKKYEKYIKYKHRDEIVAIDFITNKLIITLLFVLLAFLSSIFNDMGLTIV